MESASNRRPIRARSTRWATRTAAALATRGVTPNQISVASIVFAALGAALLAWWPTAGGLLLCALMIQARLLCNLFDGMVAIEGGMQTPSGALYNEFPDRIADSLLFVALGYAIGQPWLGWLIALAAIGTAYVRVFGGALGLPQDFRGPFAKQQRMAVLTAACLLGVIERFIGSTDWSLTVAVWLLAVGTLLTCVTRTRAIAAELARRGSSGN